jgi:molybdopterin molybdotransferase
VISETEALDRILAAVAPLPAESIPLVGTAGRFSAEEIHSPIALPALDQSSMDGYAVRAADTPGALRLVGEQPAGIARALTVGQGETVRIFTGAPMPAGADAVVMQEDVEADGDIARIGEAIPPGEFVRRSGSDVCRGQRLLGIGEPITPARIGLLCASGIQQIKVHRKAQIGIISSGNELRQPGERLAPGEIFDSNVPMLAAQLSGVANCIDTAHAPDDDCVLAERIRALSTVDAIILSAGVSVGDYDPVHEALRRLGAEVGFWRVAVKPGKPFLFARLGSQWIFGLPGNPVSSFVTAHLFVRPALARLSGASAASAAPARIRVPLATPIENPGPRPHYVRATIKNGLACPAALQQSHGLSSLAASDLLVRVPADGHLQKGDLVDALPITF